MLKKMVLCCGLLIMVLISCSDSGNININGIRCIKGANSFYKNGKLKYAILSKEDQEIQGVICKGRTEVTFYKNGRLKMAYLARNQEIQGIYCHGYAWVTFYKNGKLKTKDQRFQGFYFVLGTWCF